MSASLDTEIDSILTRMPIEPDHECFAGNQLTIYGMAYLYHWRFFRYWEDSRLDVCIAIQNNLKLHQEKKRNMDKKSLALVEEIMSFDIWLTTMN